MTLTHTKKKDAAFTLRLTADEGVWLKNILRHYKSPYEKGLNGFPLELKNLLEFVVTREWR